MTALDAALPGLRQRLDPVPGRPAGDEAAREEGRAFTAALDALAGRISETATVAGPRALADPAIPPLAGTADGVRQTEPLQSVAADAAGAVQTALDALLVLTASAMTAGQPADGRSAAGRAPPSREGEAGRTAGTAEAIAAAVASLPALPLSAAAVPMPTVESGPEAAPAPAGSPSAAAKVLAGAAAVPGTAAPSAAPAPLPPVAIHVMDRETHFAPVRPAGSPPPADAAPPAAPSASQAAPAAAGTGTSGPIAASLPAMPGAAAPKPAARPGPAAQPVRAGAGDVEPVPPEEASPTSARTLEPVPRGRFVGDGRLSGQDAEQPARPQANSREADASASRVATIEAAPAPTTTAEVGTTAGTDRPATALPAATLVRIADAVVAEATAAAPSTTAATGTKPAEGPLRLLTLQLQPVELGAVVIRMRLQDGRLEVGLHAERDATADLLNRDGAALADLLRGAGYQPDVTAVQPGAGSGASQGDGSGRGQPAFPSMAGGQHPGGSNPDQPARRQPELRETSRAPMRESGHEAQLGERDRPGQYL